MSTMNSPATESRQKTGFKLSQQALRASEQPISYLMAQAVANPSIISLAAGLVDYQTLPGNETEKLMHDLLASPETARIALQYGTTEGLEPLRQTLLEHMASLDRLKPSDLGATVNDVVVTTGSQQLLFILTDVMVNPGDIVITEWPSYFVYTGLLEAAGAHVRCVDIDHDGIIPQKLDALLDELKQSGELSRVKIVYTCDYHQNPSGITLSEERRPQVLEIVKKYSTEHRILIIEDAAYRELTFEGMPPRSIKSYDAGNEYVALCQTFSKPFSPGMKTGYGVLPRELVEAVVQQKGSHDFGSVNLVQHILLQAMRQGIYARHVDELCDAYADKRNATLAAIEEHFAPGSLGHGSDARWTTPRGGMYIWLTLPDRFDTGKRGALFHAAIEQGVLYVPGEYCFGPDPKRTIPRNSMRLSYGTPTTEQIHEGIGRLAKAAATLA